MEQAAGRDKGNSSTSPCLYFWLFTLSLSLFIDNSIVGNSKSRDYLVILVLVLDIITAFVFNVMKGT